MLINASLDASYPFEITVKGSMTAAKALTADGTELSLEEYRSVDGMRVGSLMWHVGI